MSDQPIDIAAITARNAERKRLMDEASPGPWVAWSVDCGASSSWAGDKAQIAGLPRVSVDRGEVFTKADAAFIATARSDTAPEDIEALVAEVQRLRESVAEEREQCAVLADSMAFMCGSQVARAIRR